ncbi:MAG: amidohydrolase family protein [Acidimicrobiales bacterium]|jgi:imidazolonepropionase-like amidohydrolase|nr:amidohydrolase family protein [Acidimicrobiales bacterium]MDP6299372.1 amidohydrolase family protein [Acidimicrobiales bacterium]
MEENLLISGGTLIDGTGSPPKPNDSIYIRDGKIIALGSVKEIKEERLIAEGEEFIGIDASGKTIMPGLIDSHLHCSFDDVQSNDELFFHRDPTLVALVTAQNLKKILRAGITSFVDPDSVHGIGPALRDAVNANVTEGPRIKAGYQALLTAVGGTAGRLIPDEGTIGYAQVVNSKDEVIQWTRRHIKYGADWIKIHATGSIPGRSGELMVWSREEIRAACQAAHELSVPVMAHCREAESIQICAEEGVDLILHASFMNEAGLEAIIDNGASICPTFTFLANLADFGSKVGASPGMEDIFRGEIEQTAKMVRKAYDNGVRIIAGSESGFALTPYGHWHARELEVFVEVLGLTPIEAITTATKNGAWTMLMEDQLGTLEEGKLADLLIVDGNPCEDISILNDKNRIETVISRGQRVVFDDTWPSHDEIPGWKVGNWGDEILTWDKAYGE